MAKKRVSKKHRKNNKKNSRINNNIDNNIDNNKIKYQGITIPTNIDEFQITSSNAGLCALAPVIKDKKVFEPIHNNVNIRQKKIFYSPTDKLVFLTLGIMSGMQTVYDINYKLRVDKALLKAFGYQKCADQSVIQETLNAVTDENIKQMESALDEIFKQNNLSASLIEKAQKDNRTITIDIDLSGQIASKNAEQSTKGYFSGKKNAYGRQLARVLVSDTQEIAVESLYSGNTVSWDNDVFKATITKMEYRLNLYTQAQRNSIRLRLDGGFGTDKNVNYALWCDYQLLAKMRCSSRARKLSKSVTQWVDIPSDSGEPSKNNPRQAGLVTTPHRYGRRTRQIAIKKATKKGYTYSVLVTTDTDSDILSIVSDYDARGGVPESSFCQDGQGLSNTKRRKRSFLGQQMLMLLNQLAHNMIVWIKNWLTESMLVISDESLGESSDESSDESLVQSSESQVYEKSLIIKTVKERGMKRFVHQLLSISGLVTLKGQKVCSVAFNPSYSLVKRIVIAFRTLLKPYGIMVSLDET